MRKKAVALKTGEKTDIKTARDYFYEALSQTEDFEGYREKIKLYTKAIELDPGYEYAYNNRGVAYNELSEVKDKQANLDKAIQDYNKAIELDPKNVNAYNGRGFSYSKLSEVKDKQANLELSIQYYTKGIELDDKLAQVYNNLSALYFSQNQTDKSINTAKKSVDILEQKLDKDPSDKRNQYMYLGAKNLAGIEDDQTTINNLAKFIQQNPDYKNNLKNDQNMEWIRIKDRLEFKKLLSK